MTNVARTAPLSQAASTYPVLQTTDIHAHRHGEADRELFDRFLRDFVPPNSFDAHAHLYDLRHLVPEARPEDFAGPPEIGHEVLLATMRQWMGDRVVSDGLYFPFPDRRLDCRAANDFLAADLRGCPESRGLMMIRPQDDPNAVAAQHGRLAETGGQARTAADHRRSSSLVQPRAA